MLRFRIESQRPKAKTIAYRKMADLNSMITSQKRVLAASKSISSSRNCVNKITSALRLRPPGNNISLSISVTERAHQAMLIGGRLVFRSERELLRCEIIMKLYWKHLKFWNFKFTFLNLFSSFYIYITSISHSCLSLKT